MKLSIIVPVYNVEKYLARCVDSLLDQGDFKDYEIILINDGSTDGSLAICKQYEVNDNRIRVLDKENGGMSSARNAGLKIARGEYVMFVDSDDYIQSHCLVGLLQQAQINFADIVSYNFSYIHENSKIEENQCKIDIDGQIISGDEWLLRSLKQQRIIMVVWKNLYKRSLIFENNVFFREGFYHEDEEWTPRIFHIAQKVLQYEQSIYGYCIRSNSTTNDQAKNKRTAIDLVDNCERLSEYYSKINNVELKHLMEDYTATLVLSAFFKGELVEDKVKIETLLNQLYLGRKNSIKFKLFRINPKAYLIVNKTLKQFKRNQV